MCAEEIIQHGVIKPKIGVINVICISLECNWIR